MKWKHIKWRVQYALQYFPFTLNTALCAVAVWVAYRMLYKPTPKGEIPSSLIPFILLMGKMAFWFAVGLIGLSILSTIVSWVHYMMLKRNKQTLLKVSFTTEQVKGKRNKLYLNATLEGAMRPLLGFVKGRLYYDDNMFTDRFSLLSDKRKENSIWRAAITGRSRFSLPDIKEYEIRGGFVYFQDMLHLFSLAVKQPMAGHFYQPPVLLHEQDNEVSPKKTETLDVRIEQMRRVEGEYLNYKDFEAGDDVRRIVWKVYARNRELVVRIPEMFEPFASHLYYYASFHAQVKAAWMGEGYMKEMLNYYKNSVWTVYDTLAKKEWQMRYVPDQNFQIPEHLEDGEKAAHIVSNSTWHQDKELNQYFNPKHGTVLCISSFTDPVELDNLLEKCDSSTIIYFVKTSNVFRHFAPLDWVSRIILQPSPDRLSRLRSRWLFSPMRLQVHRKEKEIETLLKKSSVVWGEI